MSERFYGHCHQTLNGNQNGFRKTDQPIFSSYFVSLCLKEIRQQQNQDPFERNLDFAKTFDIVPRHLFLSYFKTLACTF